MRSSTLTPIVLILIVSLGLASFAMCHFSQIAHKNCLVDFIGNTECNAAPNSIQSALSHINALESFSSGIINAVNISIIFSLFLILYFSIEFLNIKKLSIAFNKLVYNEEAIIVCVRKYLRWLFLHEKRDPYIFYAAA